MKTNKKNLYFFPILLNHQIFLTKEERYNIYAGKKVAALGSLVETTVFQKDDEKIFQKEIFVNYEIDIEALEEKVEICNDFYKIHLPITFKHSEFNDNAKKFNDYIYIEDILDEEDGGKQQLFFKYRKIYTHENKNFVTLHCIEIKDESILKNSLCFIKMS